MPWYNPFKSRKNKDGEEKVDDKAALADAGNGRYLVEIEAKEYNGNINVRDINEIVEIDIDGQDDSDDDSDDDDDDDDDSDDDGENDLLDEEFVLVKARRGLKFLAMVKHHDDVPKNTVRVNALGRKNISVGSNDIVTVAVGSSVSTATKVVFQVVDETVEDFDGTPNDIIRAFLQPYYFNVSQLFPMGRPVTTGALISCNGANTTAWFRVEAIYGRNGSKLEYGKVHYEPATPSSPSPNNTKLELNPVPISMEEGEGDLNKKGYADIGGLGEQLTQIRELIELPIRHPKLFTHIGVRPPKGVLMHGPPGTGKTLIAQAVANETGCYFKHIAGPEVMSGGAGESEKKIRSVFEDARENAPAIIFMDEIDSIAPNREKTHDETLRRMVATLLTEMDGIDGDAHVMVIGATNRPNALDPALRRAGRFDTELVIGVPSEEGRREILGILTRKQKLDNDRTRTNLETKEEEPNPEYVDLDKLANITMGFVGADLANLCSKSAVSAITRAARDIDLEADYLPVEFYENLKMGMSDFMSALPDVPPSALKEFVVAKPSVTFDDIGGLEDVKRELMEMIEFGKDNDGYFDAMGIKPPSGCMFYGPPGCGKTLMAKAMANEMESNFVSIKGPELSSKWFGESEENLRSIFEKGRQASPCILFFDEMDSLAKKRGNGSDAGVGDRVVNQLLTEMDGVGSRKDLFVIGASNMITLMDPAVMRNGRLDQLIYIPMPDLEARKGILRAVLRKTKVSDSVNLDLLAEDTEGYSGADLAGICQSAIKLVVRLRLIDIKTAQRRAVAGIPEDAKEERRVAMKKAAAEVNKQPLVLTHREIELAKQQSKPSITQMEHNRYLAQRDQMNKQAAAKGAAGSLGMTLDGGEPLRGLFVKSMSADAGASFDGDEEDDLYGDDDDDDSDDDDDEE
eukprot:g2729.t1